MLCEWRDYLKASGQSARNTQGSRSTLQPASRETLVPRAWTGREEGPPNESCGFRPGCSELPSGREEASGINPPVSPSSRPLISCSCLPIGWAQQKARRQGNRLEQCVGINISEHQAGRRKEERGSGKQTEEAAECFRAQTASAAAAQTAGAPKCVWKERKTDQKWFIECWRFIFKCRLKKNLPS